LNTIKLKGASVAFITLKGTNCKVRNKRSDSFYFILKGNGVFDVDGKKYKVKKGDLVFIPKGTVYFDSGNMDMVVFCNPRFEAKSVEYLK